VYRTVWWTQSSCRVRRMHPEETKVHRRGLMLVPGLAANHEAQPLLDL
jgi:hypothetical protein